MTKKKLQIKTIIDRRIVELFPVAIYRARLNRSFTKEELDFIQKTKTKCYKNVGNKISLDKNILDHAPFTALKKEMLKCIDDYFTNVIDPVKPIKPYITQSWINYTEPGEFHQWHSHTNSYISGGIYINANKSVDKIQFQELRYNTINILPKKLNKFNSATHALPVETGDIIVFPSATLHHVPPTKGNHTRISLAFNTFIKGVIGNTKSLTELTL